MRSAAALAVSFMSSSSAGAASPSAGVGSDTASITSSASSNTLSKASVTSDASTTGSPTSVPASAAPELSGSPPVVLGVSSRSVAYAVTGVCIASIAEIPIVRAAKIPPDDLFFIITFSSR